MNKNKTLLFTAIIIFIFSSVSAQNYDILKELKNHKTKVYFSEGNDERAKIIAVRCDNAINYFNGIINFTPDVTLLILNQEDWWKFTNFPVYGMPHYNDNKTLVIATEDNDFWKSFIPPLDKLPEELANKIRDAYTNKDGNVSMMAFFDLLALHELGHAFHFQADLQMQRFWMRELFANIFLHTYIAENEAEYLPALTVFPEMVVAGGTAEYKYTSLTDLEERYEEIGQKYPNNYGWYQSRWHSAAKDIYDAGDVDVFVRLWTALKERREKLTDSELANFLKNNVHQSVADVMLNWDK